MWLNISENVQKQFCLIITKCFKRNKGHWQKKVIAPRKEKLCSREQGIWDRHWHIPHPVKSICYFSKQSVTGLYL